MRAPTHLKHQELTSSNNPISCFIITAVYLLTADSCRVYFRVVVLKEAINDLLCLLASCHISTQTSLSFPEFWFLNKSNCQTEYN